MKIKRQDLKCLIKEIMLEVLQEGFGNDSLQERKPVMIRKSIQNNVPTRKIEQKKQSSGSVFDDIFADTAVTTLIEQSSAEHHPRSPAVINEETEAFTLDEQQIERWNAVLEATIK